MSVTIEMPKLGTMSVGTVVKWHKNVGDEVSNGNVAEIETDKAKWSWKTSKMVSC